MYHDQDCCCCCQCSPCVEATCAAITGDVLQITVEPLRTYRDYEFYDFDLCLALPARTGTEPVAIFDGTNQYAALDDNGQPVVSGKLRGHQHYLVRFGAGGVSALGAIPPHFTVCGGLCCMEYSSNAALQSPEREV